jgi:1,2-diacylglycerol 3-beta-galactosyltransferase
MTEKKKQILILTGDAGLGHRSAAEALQKAFETRYPGKVQTTVSNPLNHPDIPDVIRKSQSDYDEIIKAIPDLYRLSYKVSDSKLPVSLMEEGFTLMLLDVMRQIIDENQPDIILTTYPIYAAPLSELRDSGELEAPTLSTVTDLVTVHHVWFNKGLTRLTVPTEAVRQKALNAGLQPEQVVLTGIPVDPDIHNLKQREKSAVRKELGWAVDTTTLLVAGSPRVVSLMDILETIDSSNLQVQFILVAGGNEDLFKQFQNTNWKHPAKVYDFVDTMPKFMRASDLIMAKAGGLIVTESLASGLPLMIVHMLPGQEHGNVGFVKNHNAGTYCETPKDALETLTLWLAKDRQRLRKIAANSKSAGKAEAAFEIAQLAWDLVA